MTVSEIITAVDNFAWGPILIIFSLGCGMLFSIALKFPQIRLFKQMFVGPLVSSTTIWNLASALCGLLSLVNLACLALLYKPGVSTLRDYEAQLKHGLDPVFIPERCGIENAELWHRIIAEDYADELKAYKQVFPDK